jgi:hypothetical protein
MNNTYPLQTRLNTGAIKDVSGTTTNCCLPVKKFTVSVGLQILYSKHISINKINIQ